MSALNPRDDSCPDSESSSEVDEVEEAETFESRDNDSKFRIVEQINAMRCMKYIRKNHDSGILKAS